MNLRLESKQGSIAFVSNCATNKWTPYEDTHLDGPRHQNQCTRRTTQPKISSAHCGEYHLILPPSPALETGCETKKTNGAAVDYRNIYR